MYKYVRNWVDWLTVHIPLDPAKRPGYPVPMNNPPQKKLRIVVAARLVVLIAACVQTLCAHAQSLDVPAASPEGKAFPVRIALDQKPRDLKLEWLGKSLPLECEQGRPECSVELLLGLGMREKQKGEVHTLALSGAAADGKPFRIEKTIQRTPFPFPEQRLKVESKFTELSADDLARHKREQAEVAKAFATLTPKRLYACPFLRSVPGELSSAFGLRRFFNDQPRQPHGGIDLRAKEGDPVKAAGAGQVLLAADHFFAGKSIYLDHGRGVIGMYFHLSEINVREGQTVKAGDLIGTIGMTGRVTGPHLHYGLAIFGQLVDPVPLFEAGCRAAAGR